MAAPTDPSIPGRGVSRNPPNRFERLSVEPDPEAAEASPERPKTQFLRDTSRSVISYNKSPDLGFDASLNPYRGCEHGCSYCYARPFHEYLGFSAGLDFETRIVVKEDAPELLRRELDAPGWTPQLLTLSGVTDAYQPIERRLGLTRRCLEVLAEHRNPVSVVTKNELVTRDIDHLAELASVGASLVWVSVTSLDASLANRLEPRASTPERRLAAIRALSDASVPVGVLVAPIIPGLNDHELPAILRAAREHGAQFARYIVLRLPHGVSDIFTGWLEQHEPGSSRKVLSRVREMRGGRLYDSRFGTRMRGDGPLADQIQQLFRLSCSRLELSRQVPKLASDGFRRHGQLSLFGDPRPPAAR